MISGALLRRPRAHVDAPAAPANGLFRAIGWSFDHAADLPRGDLRILVGDPALVTRLRLLLRTQSREVRIGTADQAERGRPSGPAREPLTAPPTPR